jgi:hypothetical protein
MLTQPDVEAVRELAIKAGVCVRPVLSQVTGTMTGESHVVPIECGSIRESQCPPCADRNRRLRIQQCREGWHLDEEPPAPPPNDDDPDSDDDPDCGDGSDGQCRVRSTRRRQDVPDLPRLPVENRTVGRTFTAPDGKVWRPSMFLTVTLPSYGRVTDEGAPVDPAAYDYRRAALDAMHFAKLVDRFWQNLRRAVGYQVQYFATVEPQRRLAPHLHAAIRGAIPRALLRQVVAATYHQLWWPPHDKPVYTSDQAPVWDEDAAGYCDPTTGQPLPTWDEALDALDADPEANRLTARDVRLMLDDLRTSGLSQRSVRYVHATLRTALEHAVREEVLARNVARLVRVAMPERHEQRALSVEEAKRLLKTARDDRLFAAYVLTLVLGLRRGETLGLRWSDIDFDRQVLHVRQNLQRVDRQLQLLPPKTPRSRRPVPLPPICVRALQDHQRRVGRRAN